MLRKYLEIVLICKLLYIKKSSIVSLLLAHFFSKTKSVQIETVEVLRSVFKVYLRGRTP